VRSISARLRKKKIQEVIKKKKMANEELIVKWCQCSRLLFGSESISLRSLESLSETFKDAKAAPDRCLEGLEKHILNKIPTISKVTAREFSAAFMQACCQKERVEPCRSLHGGPIAVLLAFALLDSDDEACSFPDFIMSKLPHAWEAPPTVRLAAWCVYLREKYHEPGGIKPAGLWHSELVDQVGFPLQLKDAGDYSAHVGKAFSWSGDFHNLQDIIDAVKHGHSINWHKVREEAWSKVPVEDDTGLVRLITSCRNPKKCLEALDEKNLCDLLEKGTSENAYRLAKKVVECLADGARIQEYSPYHMAVWTLIRYGGLTEEQDSPGGNVALLEQLKSSSVLSSLLWAKDFAHQLRHTDRSVETSTRILCKLLRYASTECHGTGAQIKELWGGAFAKLLLATPSGEAASPEFAQPASVIQTVVMEYQRADPSWPAEAKALCEVYHKRANDTDIQHLWKNHPDLLKQPETEGHPHTLRAEFIPGLFQGASHLDLSLQEHLLTTGCEIPECNEVRQHKSKVDHGLKAAGGQLHLAEASDPIFRDYCVKKAEEFGHSCNF